MDRKQAEQINNVEGMGFYDMQCLLLQAGYCFDENPKPDVISSSEIHGGKWHLNPNWQAGPDNNANTGCRLELGSASKEMFSEKSMNACTVASLNDVRQNIGTVMAKSNMNIQDYVGLANTESSKNSDFFNSGNSASLSNGMSRQINLHGGQQLSAGVRQFNNVAYRILNAPLTPTNEYREHGYDNSDLNHIADYLTGCRSNPHGSLTLPVNHDTSVDFPSSYQRQEGFSHDQLRDIPVSTDQQVRQFSKYSSGDHSSYSHSEYSSVGMLRCSKYLRPTQQLLEEVCSVKSTCNYDRKFPSIGQAMQQHSKTSNDDPHLNEMKAGPTRFMKQQAESMQRAATGEERVHLQMKKARLIGMVEELDRGYQQYHEQMQFIVTSFESATGIDAAAPYTALARKFVSRKFRALRDAIGEQIYDVCRTLGDDISSVPVLNKGETPRLRLVDQRLRHHRTLQQVSMLPQAWRPQRGLPERSVAVLRAWLFEHFLHPYPKESEKLMLARLTGLTRNQVANWFINARVRLWKPMVEQMYIEEKKEAESQIQAGAERLQYEQTRFAKQRLGCDFEGNNVMALAPTQENPQKRHRYENLIQGGCNTVASHSSIMPKHGVSLTLALQRSSSEEFAPSTYTSNQHFLLHPVSADADYNIADVFI